MDSVLSEVEIMSRPIRLSFVWSDGCIETGSINNITGYGAGPWPSSGRAGRGAAAAGGGGGVAGAGGNAPPASYTINGKQYIVGGAGGNVQLNYKRGNNFIAFTLAD